jgi:hypothetical protein
MPSTVLDNELLLPNKRIGIIHPSHFVRATAVEEFIALTDWETPSVEFYVPSLGINESHILNKLPDPHAFPYSRFFGGCPPDWEKALDEIGAYATHLLILWDGKDPVVRAFIKNTTRRPLPSKLIILDRHDYDTA